MKSLMSYFWFFAVFALLAALGFQQATIRDQHKALQMIRARLDSCQKNPWQYITTDPLRSTVSLDELRVLFSLNDCEQKWEEAYGATYLRVRCPMKDWTQQEYWQQR